MTEMLPSGGGRVRIEYLPAPRAASIGYRSEFLTDTRGTGVLNHNFKEYGEYAGPIKRPPGGRAHRSGSGREQRLRNVQARRTAASSSSPPRRSRSTADTPVGVHTRDNDLDREPDQGQAAQEHPHERRRREADPDAAAHPHPRGGPRVHQRGRAGRGDAEAIRLRKRILDHNPRKRTRRTGTGQFTGMEEEAVSTPDPERGFPRSNGEFPVHRILASFG